MLTLRTLFYRTATVLALATSAACSSSSKDDPTPTTPTGLKWTVDGSALTAATTQSQKGTTTVSVAGAATSGTTANYLALEIPNAVGTYTFSPTSAAAGTYSVSTSAGNTVYNAGANFNGTVTGAGTIVVTAITATNVTGTFTFTGISSTGASKSITNGTFNVGL